MIDESFRLFYKLVRNFSKKKLPHLVNGFYIQHYCIILFPSIVIVDVGVALLFSILPELEVYFNGGYLLLIFLYFTNPDIDKIIEAEGKKRKNIYLIPQLCKDSEEIIRRENNIDVTRRICRALMNICIFHLKNEKVSIATKKHFWIFFNEPNHQSLLRMSENLEAELSNSRSTHNTVKTICTTIYIIISTIPNPNKVYLPELKRLYLEMSEHFYNLCLSMSNSSLAIENGFFIFEALNKLDELSKNIEPRTAMVIPRNSEILKKAICVLNKILPIVESNLNVNNLNQFNPELINKILSTPWLEMLKNCILVSIHFPRDNIELHKIYITQIAKIIKACFTERSCEYSQNKEEMIRVISNALLIIDTYDGSNNNTIKELIGYFCPLNPYLAN